MGDLAKVRSAVTPILAGLRHAGADIEHALATAKLDAAEISDPEGRVLHERVVHLWKIAVDVTGDEDFGLRVSGMIGPGAFGVVEYGFRKSPTLMEGMRRVCRYFRINHDVASMDVHIDGDRVVWEHSLPGARSLPRAAADFVLSNPIRIAQDAIDGELSALTAMFDYPEPDDTTALVDRFGAKLEFSSGRRALVFSLADTARSLRQSEPGLCAILDQHAKDMLAKFSPMGTFADRVRELLAGQLSGGDPTAQEMARALKMSVRTLHRRLTEEGTSHKLLLAQLRQELAGKYLRDSDMGVSEVAFLLGFSEPSAFHRAFRRWTDMTPAAFRASG